MLLSQSVSNLKVILFQIKKTDTKMELKVDEAA